MKAPNGTMTLIASFLGIVLTAFTILSILGILPWATRVDLQDHKAADAAAVTEEGKRFDRADSELSDIHQDMIELLTKAGLPHNRRH